MSNALIGRGSDLSTNGAGSALQFSGSALMLRHYILFHLKEAQEELERTANELASAPDYSECDLEAAMGHLYNHLNTAWNARNATDEETTTPTEEQFYRWRQFPRDIDMGP